MSNPSRTLAPKKKAAAREGGRQDINLSQLDQLLAFVAA